MVGVQRVFCGVEEIADALRKFRELGLTKGSWEFLGPVSQVEVRAWKGKK